MPTRKRPGGRAPRTDSSRPNDDGVVWLSFARRERERKTPPVTHTLLWGIVRFLLPVGPWRRPGIGSRQLRESGRGGAAARTHTFRRYLPAPLDQDERDD